MKPSTYERKLNEALADRRALASADEILLFASLSTFEAKQARAALDTAVATLDAAIDRYRKFAAIEQKAQDTTAARTAPEPPAAPDAELISPAAYAALFAQGRHVEAVDALEAYLDAHPDTRLNEDDYPSMPGLLAIHSWRITEEPPAAPDAARPAVKLTDAQRRALKSLAVTGEAYTSNRSHYEADGYVMSKNTARSLVERGFAEWSGKNNLTARVRITPAGREALASTAAKS